MQPVTIWLVTRVGVYDQGVAAVYPTRAEAETFCALYAPDLDGHHHWRIDEVPVHGPVPHAERHGLEEVEEAERRLIERRFGHGYGDTLPPHLRRRPTRTEVNPLEA